MKIYTDNSYEIAALFGRTATLPPESVNANGSSIERSTLLIVLRAICNSDVAANRNVRAPFLIRIATVLSVLSLFMVFAAGSFAHPASGIVVSANGEVFFVHTGQGLCKIEAQGRLTYLHKDTGGHWVALDTEGKFAAAADNRLFKRVALSGAKSILLFASGGAPLVVNRDGNLYYGSGFPGGDDTTPGGHTVTRMSPGGKKTLFAPELKATLEKLGEAVTGLAAGPDGILFVACPSAI